MPRTPGPLLVVALLLSSIASHGNWAVAGVVVVCNRSSDTVAMEAPAADGTPVRRDLPPRDVVALAASDDDTLTVRYRAGTEIRRAELPASSIHGFFERQGELELLPLLLPPPPPEGEPVAEAATPPPLAPGCVVPVKLLTDDDEATLQSYWEPLLRQRVAAASKIFEKHCRVRFEVVAVDTWDSDDTIDDFEKSIVEFEREIAPHPARLAIGFTSQYRIRRPGDHLGATRAPLHTHVLIREWVPHTTETERLEVLLHELGHFLGASHAQEYDSVMRPNLADQRSRARSFRVGFDPFNTFIMYLLAEELRSGKFHGFSAIRPRRKAYLQVAYQALAKLHPDDKTPLRYLALLEGQGGPQNKAAAELTRRLEPLTGAAREVVLAITQAARRNHTAAGEGRAVLSGDRLTEHLVRSAAAAAKELPEAVGPRGLLLGLGIGLDDSTALRDFPLFSDLCRSIESDEERQQRLDVLGSPTMRGRRDLAQHFYVSAALGVMLGPQEAEVVGLLKEVRDARGGSGFSFADLNADLAGVAFAVYLTEANTPIGRLAELFTVKDFLPEHKGLAEGIPWEQFAATYGTQGDKLFERERAAIRRNIAELPPYRSE